MISLVHESTLVANLGCAEETQDPVSNLQSNVATILLLLVSFLEEEKSNGQADQHNDAADEVRQQIRELVEYRATLEISWIVAHGICECATESSSDYASVVDNQNKSFLRACWQILPYAPYTWHDTKSARCT